MTTDRPVQTAAPELILPLSSAAATLARAGGKGANLAALTRAGFEVPPGFIVTTAAYHAFVAANQIEMRLLELAHAVSPSDPASLDSTSEAIRALFSGGTLPEEIAESIRAAYAGLPAEEFALGESGRGCRPSAGDYPPVAVRSSATAEDLPGLSFAGQQDTYLNIVGPAALADAVKACWGSLWTARALGYRARSHIAPDYIALAVIVQVLIPADVSGVLFTANPLSGHRGEMVIDATFGLGEALVSGQVEPDHYVVDPRAWSIVSRKLGAKAMAIVPSRAGGTESVSQDRRQQQALPNAQILDLARTAAQVAAHFGSPQDIEWAWAGGRLYLLQSRPITTLYPLPESLLRAPKLRVLFSFNSVQGVPDPITPLGQDVILLVASGLLRTLGVRHAARDVLLSAGGRLYIDLTDLLASRRGRRFIVDVMLANADPGAREAVCGLIAAGRIPTGTGVRPGNVVRLLWVLLPVITRMPLTWLRPAARRAHAIREADAFVLGVQQAMRQASSLPARIAVMDQVVPSIMRKVIYAIMPALVPGILSQAIVAHLLTRWAGAEASSVWQLLRGLPGNPTTEMDLQLWAAAQAIRSDPASKALFATRPGPIAEAFESGRLPPAAQSTIQSFLDRYGMRAVAEIDIGRPRWRDDPLYLIQNLSSYLQIDDPEVAPDRVFQRAGAEADRLAADYVAQVRQKQGGLRARVLAALIRRMRLLAGLREMPKFYLIKLFDVLRTALLDSGRELTAQGRLERADDIFFVPLDTLRAVAQGEPADLKAIVTGERAAYDVELARPQMPRLLLSTGEAFYQGLGAAGSNDLIGDGVSPGMVEGPVRVVVDPRGVRLVPGEILVCPATDPGWTPLFLSAGGLVMELGGMMTHGSVVAREYGIPAVVGVHDATHRLQTGQRVRVDGSAGRIVLLDREVARASE